MQIVDVNRLPTRYTGFFAGRDADGARFRVGYLQGGHPEGPEFVWDARGIEAQWSRAPRLPWAESTCHGPRWRWYRDGSPAHEALFEDYYCLRQRAFTPDGAPVPTRRFAMPEPWNLWQARQSPIRDVAYWTDAGVIGYAPLHDPGPIRPLPRELVTPGSTRPEALVRALAPLTRRAVFQPAPSVRDHLEALEAAVTSSPDNLEAWAVLADAQSEAGHPLGPAAASVVAILRARDVDHALQRARRLAPVEDWARVLAERAWSHQDRSGVERAASDLGVRLPPPVQLAIERLADQGDLHVRGALWVLAVAGRGSRTTGIVETEPRGPAVRGRAFIQWAATVVDEGHLALEVWARPPARELPPPIARVGDNALRIELTTPAERPDAPPLGVPEGVLSLYRRFVSPGSTPSATSRW